jgi:hypothetical protein
MDLNDLEPSRPRRRVLEHFLLWAVAGSTLCLFAIAEDRWRGKAEVEDAIAFNVVFLATGYFLAWLPQIWQGTDQTPLAGLITPLFMTLSLAYLYFAFRAAFVQPTATAIAIIAQLVSLIILAARSN